MGSLEQIECADCGCVLWDSDDEAPSSVLGIEQREPCPNCGSTRRKGKVLASVSVATKASVSYRVERGVNTDRIAVLLFLLAAALAVGLPVGFESGVVLGIVWGVVAVVGMAALVAVVFRHQRVRRWAMSLIHRITGR